MRGKWLAATILLIAALLIGGYIYQTSLTPPTLRVTTTTSLYATGLLDHLVKEFEAGRYVKVQIIAVGSGEALRRASIGEADLVLSHAPHLEKEYLTEGYLKPGEIFAYNSFIIVGPEEDPAGIRGKGVLEAFKLIYEAGSRGEATFISRGDNSGTHNRELKLWELVSLDPRGQPWYREAGSGMAETLRVASELRAYTLSDIGTYLELKRSTPGLEALVTGGGPLMNIYSVYVVNGARVPGVNEDLAAQFKEFLLSEEGQALIEDFGVDEFGGSLFNPAWGDPEGELRKEWERLAEG